MLVRGMRTNEQQQTIEAGPGPPKASTEPVKPLTDLGGGTYIRAPEENKPSVGGPPYVCTA